MTKKVTFTIVVVMVLSPIIILSLVHYFQDKKSEVMIITVPTKELDNTLN